VPNERPPDRESGGKRDYRGPFDPAFRLADLSDGTLVAVAREFQEQVHLLTSSAELSIADRLDADTAREIIASQWVAASWVGSERGGVEAMAHAVEPRARLADVAVRDGSVAIEVTVDAAADPAPEPPEVAFMRISGTSSWVFDATAGTSAKS